MFPAGDSAVVIQLGDGIDAATHMKVRLLAERLSRHPFDGMMEAVPAYATVTVTYDSLRVYRSYLRERTSAAAMRTTGLEGVDSVGAGVMEKEVYPYQIVTGRLERIIKEIAAAAAPPARTVDIPVCYGGEFGPDLAEVAARNGLSAEEVIRIHASAEYLVYMIGFAPGFPYLGGMSGRIAAPRRSTPRLAIPAGSVGIAGEQTGVYPLETPGGWQLIGRTPIALFLPVRSPPSLLRAGDKVRFRPISRMEYEQWEDGAR
jgi:inhibitor of KinA